MRGLLLDVEADPEANAVNLWVKTPQGARKVVDGTFRPSFYIHGEADDLLRLESLLREDSSVGGLTYEDRPLRLRGPPRRVLRVEVGRYEAFRELASEADRLGGYHRHTLFNVDLSVPLQFMLATGLFPFAAVEVGAQEVGLRDDISALDYPLPPLDARELRVEVAARGKIPTFDDPVARAALGDDIVASGDEAELLAGLQEQLRKADPDVLHTQGGDTFLFPYLRHRAEVCGLDGFHLGREPDPPPPNRGGKSFWTYGRVAYRPRPSVLRGRFHIDSGSFLYGESSLAGLVEVSRISRTPLQTVARTSPGTAITAIQVAQAVRDGVLVPWKKNQPEEFKTLKTLLVADRGGFTYDPVVGLHENVVEIDFSSLFPSIMVKWNISPETLNCDCCRDGGNPVPVVGHYTCIRHPGLLPRVLEPIIARRREFKARAKVEADPARKAVWEGRSKALKWVLVVSFGYTGYRNARFGRIECHEAINGHAREVLLKTAEIAQGLGYEIVHGIVDSLWLKGGPGLEPRELCDRVEEAVGLRIEPEGVYRWVVFLSNRTNRAGALNRYYGLFNDDRMKVRGIEVRRHDTCPYVQGAQTEMLGELAKASTVEEFHRRIPRALDVLRGRAERLRRGDVDLRELVFTASLSKGLDDYSVLNNNAASLIQLREHGVERRPGQVVRYILLDSGSRHPRKKVKAWELVDGSEQVDVEKYVWHLSKAGESLLLPFGYTVGRVAQHIGGAVQRSLGEFRCAA